MSGKASASMLRKETMGGVRRGYEEARVRRMRVCWAQGAAQRVWKEMTTRVVDGREVVWVVKSAAVVISVRVDIMGVMEWAQRLEAKSSSVYVKG